MAKIRIVLVRHAVTGGNIDGIFQGTTDGDLYYPIGYRQAQLAAQSLKNNHNIKSIDAIYSSPRTRTWKTACEISKNFNINKASIKICESLRDIEGGDWESKPLAEIAQKWPQQFLIWKNNDLYKLNIPNGEPFKDHANRIISKVKKIQKEFEKNNIIDSDKTICIVTHGFALRLLVCYFRNLPNERIKKLDSYYNTGISIIEYDTVNKSYSIKLSNDTSHLQKEDKIKCKLNLTNLITTAKNLLQTQNQLNNQSKPSNIIFSRL